MESGSEKEAGVQAAACYFQISDSPAMTGQKFASAAGFNQQERKRVLAGSDPLVADLFLSFDLLDDAIILLHEDGRIIHWNHAATALAVAAPSNKIKSIHMLGCEEPWASARRILREFQERGDSAERETRDPGSGKLWQLRLTALAYLGVFPRRLVLTIRDCSETDLLREKLREQETMAAVGTLLAGAAHQAKNTIFGLSATLDAFGAQLRHELSDDDYIVNLRTGITQMQTLLRDLLDYASPSPSQRIPVSAAAIVRRCVCGCRRLAAKTGAKIEICGDDGLVKADPERLGRAFENLVENAIQHSPPKGTVMVRLSRTEGNYEALRVEIEDEGPGFPPESMAKLFTPFVTFRPGGTGLGLTIAKRIVESAGGAIRISNRASRGALVTVAIPLCDSSATSTEPSLVESTHAAR